MNCLFWLLTSRKARVNNSFFLLLLLYFMLFVYVIYALKSCNKKIPLLWKLTNNNWITWSRNLSILIISTQFYQIHQYPGLIHDLFLCFCNVKYGITISWFKMCNIVIEGWFKLPFPARLIPDNDKQNPNQNDKITMHVSCFLCIKYIFVACFEITRYVQMSVDYNTSVVLCIVFQRHDLREMI